MPNIQEELIKEFEQHYERAKENGYGENEYPSKEVIEGEEKDKKEFINWLKDAFHTIEEQAKEEGYQEAAKNHATKWLDGMDKAYINGYEQARKDAIEIVDGAYWGGFATDDYNKLAKERSRKHDKEIDMIIELLHSMSEKETEEYVKKGATMQYKTDKDLLTTQFPAEIEKIKKEAEEQGYERGVAAGRAMDMEEMDEMYDQGFWKGKKETEEKYDKHPWVMKDKNGEIRKVEDIIAEAIEQTRKDALEEPNSLLRSALSIARRKGLSTNWEAFEGQIEKELEREHEIIYGRPLHKQD